MSLDHAPDYKNEAPALPVLFRALDELIPYARNDDAALQKLLAPAGTDGLTDPDDAPETPSEPVTRTGDVWVLGRHRIICGDSTVATDVERVLAGARPHLMVTDPPYGVEYDPNWRNDECLRKDGSASGGRAIGKVENDGVADWRDAWALFSGDVAFVWASSLHAHEVAASLHAHDFELRIHSLGHRQAGKERDRPLHPETGRVHAPADREQQRAWRRDLRAILGLGHHDHRLRANRPHGLRDRAEPGLCRRGGDALGEVRRRCSAP